MTVRRHWELKLGWLKILTTCPVPHTGFPFHSSDMQQEWGKSRGQFYWRGSEREEGRMGEDE